jgi:hypothetical protein
MNRLRAANSVVFSARDTAPGSGTPQYATSGNPGTSTPATIFPAYAWNMLQDEMMAVLAAAGVTPDDTNWAQLLAALNILYAPAAAVARATPYYNQTGGSYSVTIPANMTRAKMTIIGGGGSGAGADASQSGGGGGGGGIGIKNLTGLVPGQAIAGNIGGAGAAATAGNSGSTGGATTAQVNGLGTIFTANGGLAGAYGSTPAGGNGGTVTSCDLNYPGSSGGDGAAANRVTPTGNGAPGYLGAGGGRTGNGAGVAGTAPGAGGGSSYGASGGSSGAGFQGAILLEWAA